VADDPYAYLSGLSEHPDRPGDTSNFNPAFASSLASALRQANAQGLHLGVMSGYRDPGQTGSAYDAGGNSSHTYGLASDISGLDGPNGKITNQWATIAAQNGLHNPYGVGDTAEFNHWQLPPQPLEQTPGLLNQLKTAKASGDMSNVWNAYNAAQGTAIASTIARPATAATSPNAPATTTLFAGVNPDARGMRNNNPGNLEANSYTAAMPGYQGSDGRFAIFDTPQHGAAALDQNLSSYGSKGINTPLAIASRWAPTNDNNNPNSYGAQIARGLGVGLNDKIDMSDPATRSKITQSIALVENGPGNSPGVKTTLAAASAPTPPGTTLNSAPAAGALGAANGPALPGFTPAQSNQFLQGASGLDKAMGGQGLAAQPGAGGGGQDQMRPSTMIGQAPAPHIPNPQAAAQTFGTTLNNIRTPLQWGSGTPGSSISATAGPAVAAGVPQGMTAQELQQLQMMQMMGGGMGTTLSSPYGGGYG
jgi:hypothetical protein